MVWGSSALSSLGSMLEMQTLRSPPQVCPRRFCVWTSAGNPHALQRLRISVGGGLYGKVDLDIPALFFYLCFSVLSQDIFTQDWKMKLVLCAHVSRLISRDDFLIKTTCEGNSHHYHHHHRILLSLLWEKRMELKKWSPGWRPWYPGSENHPIS